MAMPGFAVFCRVLLVLNAAALAHRRVVLPLRRRLLRDSAIFMVLGASALFHSVADPNTDASHGLAAAGFLMWLAGVALLLLAFTAGRFPAAARLAAQLVEEAFQALF
ncbi:unnamed protein product [Urochloa decumbens]|uniref:Uncharacterized protein n=1 Tax=Urochloa decumbens TaxID=240449 RepID=A0ABC9H2B7_9POAL